jgi:peptidyl-Lys metalloendopeptidase
MIHSLRRRFWLVGSVVSVSLLGACAPEEEGVESAQSPETHSVGQDLSAGTELKNLEVSLASDQSTFSASERAQVKVTLRNTAKGKSVKLLKWFSPADGLEESLFVITRDGKELAFEGPHYKRPAATEADYLALAAGESQTFTVDLGETYDLTKTGDYSLRFAVGPLSSNTLKLSIEGRASAKPSEPAPSPLGALTFSKCDSSQTALVQQAVADASNYANGATTYLSGTPSATARYTTWFGAYSSSGWNTAKSHFVSIKDAFDTKAITVDCGCKKKYYAYVYPNQPYTIYVCSVFWQAPATGTDSKAGTLIHEMSHFTVTAGTDDLAYGQSAAKSLAISDPSKALNNADSHEYFAENNPAQQ